MNENSEQEFIEVKSSMRYRKLETEFLQAIYRMFAGLERTGLGVLSPKTRADTIPPSQRYIQEIKVMRVSRNGVCAVLFMTLAVPVLAQSTQNAPAEPSSPQAPAESTQAPAAARSARRARRSLCWREAGISPAAMNQRWKIEDSAKGKIRAVCSDPALSADQRRGKIGEINAEKEQEIAKLIPAKQLEAFKACQAEQDRELAKGSGKTPKELGPCGGIIPPKAAAPEHMHE
jgi:hypothetical protein